MSARDWVELVVLVAGLLVIVLPRFGVPSSSLLLAVLRGVVDAGNGRTASLVVEALAGAGPKPTDQLRAVIEAVEEGDHQQTKAAIQIVAQARGVQDELHKAVQAVTVPPAPTQGA